MMRWRLLQLSFPPRAFLSCCFLSLTVSANFSTLYLSVSFQSLIWSSNHPYQKNEEVLCLSKGWKLTPRSTLCRQVADVVSLWKLYLHLLHMTNLMKDGRGSFEMQVFLFSRPLSPNQVPSSCLIRRFTCWLLCPGIWAIPTQLFG